MTYDIGSKSLIFKQVSMYLQDSYLSTLEVSDEYTLDLAKCIYDYLRDFYPNRHKTYYLLIDRPEDFSINSDKYFIKDTAGHYINASKSAIFAENTFYTVGLELSVADIYVLGLQKGILNDGSRTYNNNFPGIFTYRLSGYTRDFTPAEQAKNLLAVSSDTERIYNIRSLTHIFDILEDPKVYELEDIIASEDALRSAGATPTMTDDELNELRRQLSTLQTIRKNLPDLPTNESTLQDITNFIDTALKQVNKYNIVSWPINESILQFLIPEVVITENSSEEDIAQMQLLAESLDYQNYIAGYFDPNLTSLFKEIQLLLIEQNDKVLVHGYCDTFTERYLRTKNDIRTEVY